jgi:centrosomal CEP192-like protein/HYDIN/CFA65/VesB family protein
MASRCPFSVPFRFLAKFHPQISLRFLIFAAALASAGLSASSAFAQFQQSLVFSSGGAVAVRNDQTGALTTVSASPFPATTGSIVLDVNGRFVFSADRAANSIHMYAITDSTTGAYNEVTPGSPFASPVTQQPVFIAVEPTGNFIAVVNYSGLLPGQSAGEASIETFQIQTSPPALVPVAGSAMALDSTPLGFVQPPGSPKSYLYLGPAFPATPGVTSGEELDSFTIDPQTGFLHAILNSPDNSTARSFAFDPQGRFLVLGHGELEGILDVQGINDSFPSGNFVLPQNVFPTSLYVDSTGSFVYAEYDDGQPPPAAIHIFSLNSATGVLTESPSSPLPGFTQVPSYFPDPTGAFQFGFDPQPNLVHAFSVDPLTGYFLEAAGSPFTITGIGGSLTFSIPPGQQGIGGPSIVLSATSLSFGSVQTGSSSSPQLVTLTSNGQQPLSINSLSLSGADASQFTESDTCHAPAVIQPNNFCTASIVFAPTATGSQQAALVVTDNAPNSPQSVQLSGAGVAPPPPAPAVTISPNPLNFPTIMQGTTSSPMIIVVTNSGNATLNIASITLTGNNASDFNMVSACSGSVAPGANCGINVTFTPLAAGQRSATISISDDASDSPQIINVAGTATPAPPTTPIVALSPGSLGFGTITQGTSSAAQTITVTNAGGAPLHISSVALGGASPADYVLTNGCTASPYAVNSSCSLSVSFAPLSTGSRAATIVLTDDAPNSPQTLSLSGTANPAFAAGPAQNGSTSATVGPGQTAQFNLQLTPGAGYSGTVSLSCAGVPLAAACQAPATIQISSGNPTPFTVSITTTGGTAAISPPIQLRPGSPFAALCAAAALYVVVVVIFLLVGSAHRFSWPRTKRIPLALSAGAFAILVLINSTGCGGGSSSVTTTPPPPPIVTPQGTSTITITPSASSLGGKPLQLPAMQLTLTVN